MKNVKNGGAIPKASTLREIYVPKLYEKRRADVKLSLAGHRIAVIVDETTDSCQRYTLNVIAVDLDQEHTPAKLIATSYIDKVSHATVAQEITCALHGMDIDFNNVLAVVSDNAAYMKKCYSDILSSLFPNSVHVTCWAHTLHLAVEAFRHQLPSADAVVASGKSIFAHAPSRRQRWLQHLKSEGAEEPTLPPEPVITRWGTWLSAAKYYSVHAEQLASFLKKEQAMSNGVKLAALADTLKTDAAHTQLGLAATWAEKFNVLIKTLEGRSLTAPDIYNKVKDFHTRLVTAAEDDQTGALAAAATKLELYMSGGKQPALQFFKTVRLLDPSQFMMLLNSHDEAAAHIPALQDCKTEWEIYRAIVKELPAGQPVSDVFNFWMAQGGRMPILSALAAALCRVPCSSAEVERSFSKYKQILGHQRTRLSTTSLVHLNFIYFNYN